MHEERWAKEVRKEDDDSPQAREEDEDITRAFFLSHNERRDRMAKLYEFAPMNTRGITFIAVMDEFE